MTLNQAREGHRGTSNVHRGRAYHDTGDCCLQTRPHGLFGCAPYREPGRTDRANQPCKRDATAVAGCVRGVSAVRIFGADKENFGRWTFGSCAPMPCPRSLASRSAQRGCSYGSRSFSSARCQKKATLALKNHRLSSVGSAKGEGPAARSASSVRAGYGGRNAENMARSARVVRVLDPWVNGLSARARSR